MDYRNREFSFAAGPPYSIIEMDTTSGIVRKTTEIKAVYEPADSFASCNNRYYLVNNHEFYEVEKGVLKNIQLNFGDNPASPIDSIFCDRFGYLYGLDSDNNLFFKIDEKRNTKFFTINDPTDKDSAADKKRKKITITDVSFDDFGWTYVLDSTSRTILVFDRKGNRKYSIPLEFSTDTYSCRAPQSIAVDSEKDILVYCSDTNTIYVFDSYGNPNKRIESASRSGFNFIKPSDIFVDFDDKLYVIDQGSKSLRILDIKNNGFIDN